MVWTLELAPLDGLNILEFDFDPSGGFFFGEGKKRKKILRPYKNMSLYIQLVCQNRNVWRLKSQENVQSVSLKVANNIFGRFQWVR